MARDHRKLRVFTESHELTLAIYKETRCFPRDEWFGLRSQIRRAAASVPSNIVEGSARRTTGEYLNFINVARASAAEVEYLVNLAFGLGFFTRDQYVSLRTRCERLVPQLESLVRRLEQLHAKEEAERRKRGPSFAHAERRDAVVRSS
jgi:four helix bundle protein